MPGLNPDPNDNSRELDAEGIPDLETPINQDEGMIPPRDQPIAADEFGVTAHEQRSDEPIAERVTREVPDTTADDIDLSSAEGVDDSFDGTRLVEPGSEDVDAIDDEKDSIGSMIDDDGAQSAEEAAMHITENP